MESKRLDNAALAAGISPNYINAHGKPQSISAETKRRLLDAMHQRTATKVAVTPVPNVMVYTSGKKMPMVVEGSGEYSWLLTTEEGTQYKGHVTGGKAFNLPTKLPEGYHADAHPGRPARALPGDCGTETLLRTAGVAE